MGAARPAALGRNRPAEPPDAHDRSILLNVSGWEGRMDGRTMTGPITNGRRVGGRILAALVASLAIGALTAPAVRAEDRDHGRHERHERHYDRHERWGYGAPAYGVAPPPVVYAPPVAPSINLVFPLNFR